MPLVALQRWELTRIQAVSLYFMVRGFGRDNQTPTSLRGRLVRRCPLARCCGRRLDGAYPCACSALTSERWMKHLDELLHPHPVKASSPMLFLLPLENRRTERPVWGELAVCKSQVCHRRCAGAVKPPPDCFGFICEPICRHVGVTHHLLSTIASVSSI